MAVAVDDRFCGVCGAAQEVDATPDERHGSLPADGRAPKKSSLGFLDVAGITMELLVRGVYVVACVGIAILAFQHGSLLIGGGAIAYGLYILAGGRWFVY